MLRAVSSPALWRPVTGFAWISGGVGRRWRSLQDNAPFLSPSFSWVAPGGKVAGSGRRIFAAGNLPDEIVGGVDVSENGDDIKSEDEQAVELENRGREGKLEPGLYLVATPIGNMEDITFRAIRVLKSAQRILAEDTRHSRKLLNYYNIHTPMTSYHKFNETASQRKIVEWLQTTEDIVALICDAGTPGISDPGADLVLACVRAKVPVYPIPGPSAAITALIASGLSTDEFSFVGFLPAQASARRQKLTACAQSPGTQIFYVPPHKLQSILEDCILTFGGSRQCVVARELTKIHEEFWRGDLTEAQEEFTKRIPRGEVTLLVAGSSGDALPTVEELESRLEVLLESGTSPSEASRQVAKETSVRRNTVYSLALKLFTRKREEDLLAGNKQPR